MKNWMKKAIHNTNHCLNRLIFVPAQAVGTFFVFGRHYFHAANDGDVTSVQFYVMMYRKTIMQTVVIRI